MQTKIIFQLSSKADISFSFFWLVRFLWDLNLVLRYGTFGTISNWTLCVLTSQFFTLRASLLIHVLFVPFRRAPKQSGKETPVGQGKWDAGMKFRILKQMRRQVLSVVWSMISLCNWRISEHTVLLWTHLCANIMISLRERETKG